MKKVLIFADYYLPGFKAGGPIRSISSICSVIRDRCEVYLITRDRDMSATQPYENVPTDQWVKMQGVNVMYKQNADVNFAFLREIIKEVRPNTVHLNSMMSVRFSFMPLLSLWYFNPSNAKVLLSPRGELSSGALSIKKYRKKAYLQAYKLFGLDTFVQWVASSEGELDDINKKFNPQKTVSHRIDNLPNINSWKNPLQRETPKQAQSLKMVFLARISKMKNLMFFLNILKDIEFDVSLSVYGPQEDQTYFKQCKEFSDNLASHIKVEYLGPVSADKVYDTLKEYDLFVLPTLGENFGQAIWEALASSVPVLISDQTPWKNLNAQGVGWELNLAQPEAFFSVIEQVYVMDEQQHSQMRNKSRQFALDFVTKNKATKLLQSLYTN